MGQFATKPSPEQDFKKEEILKKHRANIEKKLEELKKEGVDGMDNRKLKIFYEEISEAVLEINLKLGTGLQLRPPKDLEAELKGHEGNIAQKVTRMIRRSNVEGKGVWDTVLLSLGVPAVGALAKKGLFPHVVSDNVFVPLITSATVLALAAFRKI